jgi:aromatic ring-opening dioxygenase LigB subunit
MQAVGERMAALRPQTIVLLSPHAPLSLRQMGVSTASSYHGSFAYFRAPQVRVDAEGDVEIATALLEAAAKRGIPVAACGSGRQALDQDHGAMVPLYFAMRGLAEPSRIVVLSFSGLSIREHVRFGEAIGGVLLESSKRIVYVASGDMSHRLLADGPYGLDPHGPEFDQAVATAFAEGDWDRLLSIPAEVVDAAGECGYRSLAVLRGVVAAVEAVGIPTKNHLLSYEGPFGVGYLVGEVECLQQQQGQGVSE